MQNDSFKMRQHYAPYNRSEESHRVSEEYILYEKPPSREIAAVVFTQFNDKGYRLTKT